MPQQGDAMNQTRLRLRATFGIFALLLGTGVAPARAQTTIISVSGPEFGGGLGIFPSQSVAFSFTVSQPYVAVTINAKLAGVFTGTAFLMRSIGPDTTVADEVARATFTSAAQYPEVRWLVQPVLQNVTLPESGQYIVVLSSLEQNLPQGLSTTRQPTVVADPGVSNGPFFATNQGGTNTYPPAGSFHEPSGFGEFEVIGIPSLITVAIDVKPGSFPNTINLAALGVIPVAILSTPEFTATAEVDVSSITLAGASVNGANAVNAASDAQCSGRDVNRDGLDDLICHFDTDLEIAPGDTTVVLQGRTYTGRTIRGQDSIRIVPR
jgi:hypothetical protein